MCSWSWDTGWAAVSALATIAASLGIFLAARQLKFDAWVKAQEIWVEEKFTEARGTVFRHLDCPNLPWEPDKEVALLACRRTDEFVRLAAYFALTRGGQERLLQVWAIPVAKLWILLEQLVREQREIDGWQKWDAFEKYGKAAAARLPEKERSRLSAAVNVGGAYKRAVSVETR